MQQSSLGCTEMPEGISTFISLSLAPSKTFKDLKEVLRNGCEVRGVF